MAHNIKKERLVPPNQGNGDKTYACIFSPNLPLLLAGPMVRRVDAHYVTLWMVLSTPYRVKVQLFHQGKMQATPEYCDVVKLGEYSYVVIVQAELPKLKRPAIIEYDLEFHCQILSSDSNLTDNRKIDLVQKLSALEEFPDLLYSGCERPSFIISQQENFSFFHGSCRKPHGNLNSNTPDAMSRADSFLETVISSPTQRPAALYLTGDQIYADDVHDKIIRKISYLVKALFANRAWDMQVPAPTKNRTSYVKDRLAFYTDESQNHLLTFPEFCAMYLLVWNPRLWAPLTKEDEIDLSQAPEFSRFYLGTQALRRLCANTATYCIFDDHEVTDDWNINKNAVFVMRHNALSREVLANALAAYWAFQHVGNCEDIKSEVNARKSYIESANKAQFVAIADKQSWAYLIESPYPTVVLDTRTCREFLDKEGSVTYPILMNSASLSKLKQDIAKLAPHCGDRPMLLVSPAPIVPFWIFNSLIKLSTKCTLTELRYDPEAWFLNLGGAISLFQALSHSGQHHFIAISGDVHFSYTAMCFYVSIKNKSVDNVVCLQQLTSSALNNYPSKMDLAKNIGEWFIEHQNLIGLACLLSRVNLLPLIPLAAYAISRTVKESLHNLEYLIGWDSTTEKEAEERITAEFIGEAKVNYRRFGRYFVVYRSDKLPEMMCDYFLYWLLARTDTSIEQKELIHVNNNIALVKMDAEVFYAGQKLLL